jgi:hypothetical protein
LACADGKLYCEWQFNAKQAPVCKQGHMMSGPVSASMQGHTYWCCDNAETYGGKGCNSGLTDFGDALTAGHIKKFSCRQCDYDLCIKCAPMHTTKYTCTDPGINGQNNKPTTSVGICVHCNKPKDRHHAKGAISVKVYGLKNAQHLNGLTGRITVDLPNGRRVVQLENGEQKSLKPENLEVIGTFNEALIKLDISNNRIGAEQVKDLQCICMAGSIELDISRN